MENSITLTLIVETECSRIVQDAQGGDKPASDITLAVDPDDSGNKALFVLAPQGRVELSGLFLRNLMATQRVQLTLTPLPPSRC